MKPAPARITVPSLAARKGTADKIACITAYDHAFAGIFDEAGVDVILVGDSVGTVVQGQADTLAVTLDEMLYHTRIVRRAVGRALVVGDMPFGSYQCGTDEAVRNAGRFLKEAGAAAVKLEGGENAAGVIRALARYDIPVMGHVGLTPQSIHRMGGYKIQYDRKRILRDAKAAEAAGAFAVVLEGIPSAIAREATQILSIPTIGIGAGPDCDGQILVMHDLLGLLTDFQPRFVKRFANLRKTTLDAVRSYCGEIRSGAFPAPEHAFGQRQPRQAKGGST